MAERPRDDARREDERGFASMAAQERCLRTAVLAGDVDAWRALYERHFRALYAFVRSRTGERAQDAEDIAQECWMTAVRRIRAFDPERGGFQSWLRGIGENVLRNYWRKTCRQAMTTATPDPADPPATNAAGDAELAEHIAVVMTELPERYRAVIRAKYEERLMVAEIAARWGEPVKAVESLLGRARAAFREAYARLAGAT